ncbi:hypothetical protein OROGR_009099 [Orobanche gracilis]
MNMNDDEAILALEVLIYLLRHASHALFANLPVNLEPFGQFARLDERLDVLGFVLKDVEGDDNCVFRALSDQLFRTENELLYVRRVAVAQSGTWADLIATIAILDAFEVKMVPNVAYAISEIYPTNGRYKKVFIRVLIMEHSDSMYRVGEVPLDPLPADRISSMRASGCFTAEDLGRNKHLKYKQALED